MKRLTALLALMSLLLWLPGCGGSQASEGPAFYYLYKEPTFGANGSIFGTEPRLDDGDGETLDYLLALYLSGPISDELRSPFPQGTKIDRLQQTGNILYLTMTGSFSGLTGTGLTKTFACIALTVFDNSDTQLLILTLADPAADMVKTMELSRDSLVLRDCVTNDP